MDICNAGCTPNALLVFKVGIYGREKGGGEREGGGKKRFRLPISSREDCVKILGLCSPH